MYELRFATGVAKALQKLTAKEQERVKVALRGLAVEPRGPNCKKLRASDLYRLRVGSYLVVYGIRDQALLIIVLDVIHRSNDYESLDTLILRWRHLLNE